MTWLYAAAFVLVAASLGVAILGVQTARRGGDLRLGLFASYGIIAVMLLFFAGLALRLATTHRLAAREATRLQRQLQGLNAYIAPMPQVLQQLVRGMLVQRLFPPLIEDNEPWREPKWPDANAFLEAIQTRPDRGQDG